MQNSQELEPTQPQQSGNDARGEVFNCPACGMSCDWKPEFVGKTAMCRCGHVMKIPDLHAAEEESMLPTPHVPAPPRGKHNLRDEGPVPEAEFNDDEVDEKTARGFAGLAGYGEENPNKPDVFRDLHAPLGLIGVGLMITAGEMAWMAREGASVGAATVYVAVSTFIQLVVMFAGILGAAKVGGISFGPLGTAVLKLLAVYLAPSALGMLITQALGGDMAVAIIGYGVAAVLYWSLIAYLFRLDGQQTVTCVMAIGIARWVAKAFVIGLFLTALALGSGGDVADSGASVEEDDTTSALVESDEP